MKKILSLLSVLALLVSFGMAFSVTGEVKTKFSVSDDTFVDLNFDDAFKLRISLDQGTLYTPDTDWNVTKYFVAGNYTGQPKIVPTTPGQFKLYDYVISDALKVGLKFGISSYGYSSSETSTNGTTGKTNALDVGYTSMLFAPMFSFKLSDTMTISEKDLEIDYWGGKGSYRNDVAGSGATNDWSIDNALPKIGFGASLALKLSEELTVKPGLSFVMFNEVSSDRAIGSTNKYNQAENDLNIYAEPIYVSGDTKLEFHPSLSIAMGSEDNIMGSVTNKEAFTGMVLKGILGGGDLNTIDTKKDDGDDKKLRRIVMDNITIPVYLSYQIALSWAGVDAYAMSGGGATNTYTRSKTFIELGTDALEYKIDDTFTVLGRLLYTINNTGAANTWDCPVTTFAGVTYGGTNVSSTNQTILDAAARLKYSFSPKTALFIGIGILSKSTTTDYKGDSLTNNSVVTSTSYADDPVVEFGGEQTVGDFVVEVYGNTKISANDSSLETTYSTNSGQAGLLKVASGLAFTPGWKASLKYTKDNAFFKVGTGTLDYGKSGTSVITGVEAGYKF